LFHSLNIKVSEPCKEMLSNEKKKF
jgi:hypothetical protein